MGSLQLFRSKIERRLVERNEKAEEMGQSWESDNFEWSAESHRILRDIFKLSDFRPLQMSVINALMSKEDCLAIMSTGSGKSLCYQLPAVLLKGITLVVSPLVSLVEDQLFQLQKLGIDAATLNQSTSKEDVSRIQTALTDPKSTLRLLYVTPEKLAKSKRIMNRLEKCNELNRLKLIAIDEVHCCSQWGHDFRPDFKFLNVLKRQFRDVPVLGLTATAAADVIDDIKSILGLPAALVFRAGFNRRNLHYSVRPKPSNTDCLMELFSLISESFAKQSGIVYCFSRKECEEVTKFLRSKKIAAAHYHAYMDGRERSETHEKWIRGDVHVIVATVAFGMGIDKPDVRFVIHHSLPKSLENYYQESGRAGRDGKKAHCILFYCLNDLFRQSTMVCTEKFGLRNLYSMLAYCTQRKGCRRSMVAEHFNIDWDSSMCPAMCDICEKANGGEKFEQVDVTCCWRIMTQIIADASKTDKGRLTGTKLSELTAKKLPSYRRETVELTMANLLLEGYLQEDFHFTPYSIISYVVLGEKSISFEADCSHKVQFYISVLSSKRKHTKSRKRHRVIDENDSDENDFILLS